MPIEGENEEVVVPTPPVEGENEEVVVQTPEPTEVELEAMQEGWTPKDQWKGDPKEWRDAPAWIDRGQLLRTITSLRGEVKNATTQLTAQVGAAFKQGKAIADAQYNEKLAELKAVRRQALEEQDFVTADKLEDKIDELKENREKPQTEAKVQNVPQEFYTFVARNPWYDKNSVMKHTANAVGAQFVSTNPNATPADLYWHVEQQMKENFPQLYGGKTVKNSALPSTEGGGSQGTKSSSNGDASLLSLKKDMSDMDISIMKNLIKGGTFKNEAEYLAEYAKAPSRR